MEVQHQRRRRRDGGRRIVVAATEEGGGNDGGRERDERVMRGDRRCNTKRVHLRLRVVVVVGGGQRL
ncbi:hypothetical protein DEO72_LG3g2022 [Vigna unguiculata]|uniref:Uncharacterized protein n=1 Tax=Vigna unguiculata TaxID=3917 RepID=A0A4D6LGE9_VIGUN|nr:hypothetical protein DEO72_LG3g2022 [Vigna unguiculata]